MIATIAGGVAVAAAATTVSTGSEPEKPEPNPPPPGVPPPKRRDRDGSSPDGEVDVRPIFDPPRIEAGPSGPEARHHSVALEVHWDHGRQTVREVPHDHT